MIQLNIYQKIINDSFSNFMNDVIKNSYASLVLINCYARILEKESHNVRALVGLARSYLMMVNYQKKIYSAMIPVENTSDEVQALKETLTLFEQRSARESFEILKMKLDNSGA